MQVGRFPRDLCTCHSLRGGPSGAPSWLQMHDQNRAPPRAGHAGVPELRLTRADLEAISPGDAALHQEVTSIFERRVAAVERHVGHPFLHCAAPPAMPRRPPRRPRAGAQPS